MPSYLTRQQIEDRLLSRFSVDALVYTGDAEIASDELDAMTPFAGYKTDSEQERQFPRNGDTVVPDAVLDWVALKALDLSDEHEPGVSSEGAGRVNVSYSEPKRSQLERRMAGLIDPYLLKVGSRA